MNSDQVMSLIRGVLGVLVSVLVTRGVLTTDQGAQLVTYAVAAVGATFVLATFVWGIASHSHNAKIASVNAIPGVKVVAEDGPGVELAKLPTPTR